MSLVPITMKFGEGPSKKGAISFVQFTSIIHLDRPSSNFTLIGGGPNVRLIIYETHVIFCNI